jgi:hypothetical protein
MTLGRVKPALDDHARGEPARRFLKTFARFSASTTRMRSASSRETWCISAAAERTSPVRGGRSWLGG